MIPGSGLQKVIAFEKVKRKVEKVFGVWMMKMKMNKEAKMENVESYKIREPKDKN